MEQVKTAQEQQRLEKLAEYTKKKAALRYRLHGLAAGNPDWFKALRALHFAEQHHPGVRKDGITPSFMHQIEITNHIMTMASNLIHPVRTITACLLHDTPEDAHVSHEEIRDNFGADTMIDVELLTKEYRGEKKDPLSYFAELATSPVASVGKGGDRINNLHTMVGVFRLEKQIEYCDETRTHFFAFLKEARRRFPEQELVYENLKFTMTTQLRIFDSVHARGVAA